jgi:GT2 family glycosyltransferase
MKLTVPVLNRYDLLQRMVDSIDYPIEHLLIIDNGGGLDALKCNEFVDAVTVLDMPTNLGVAASWNLGIKAFGLDDVWHFSSADTVYGAGALEKLSEARSDEITLTKSFPHWQTFAIGTHIIQQIGLFDESFYPIYFEDTDFMRRATNALLPVKYLDIEVQHDNSSTINSDSRLKERNNQTFMSNSIYFETKAAAANYSAGSWNPQRRKENNWEK